MTEPQPVMAQAEQDQLTRQVGRSLLAVAGEGWQRVRAEYRSAGRHIEVDVHVTGSDGVEKPVRPPQEVVDGLGRLRQGMYRPGRGTWLSGLYLLEPPSTFSAEFEPDAEPRWRRVPPPIGFADELKFFPRADEHIPDWLRQRAGLPPLPAADQPQHGETPGGTPQTSQPQHGGAPQGASQHGGAPQHGRPTPPPGFPAGPFGNQPGGAAPHFGDRGEPTPPPGTPTPPRFAAQPDGRPGEPTPPPGVPAPQSGGRHTPPPGLPIHAPAQFGGGPGRPANQPPGRDPFPSAQPGGEPTPPPGLPTHAAAQFGGQSAGQPPQGSAPASDGHPFRGEPTPPPGNPADHAPSPQPGHGQPTNPAPQDGAPTPDGHPSGGEPTPLPGHMATRFGGGPGQPPQGSAPASDGHPFRGEPTPPPGIPAHAAARSGGGPSHPAGQQPQDGPTPDGQSFDGPRGEPTPPSGVPAHDTPRFGGSQPPFGGRPAGEHPQDPGTSDGSVSDWFGGPPADEPRGFGVPATPFGPRDERLP